jgi:uroporphyrin-3 C-methyltransferase
MVIKCSDSRSIRPLKKDANAVTQDENKTNIKMPERSPGEQPSTESSAIKEPLTKAASAKPAKVSKPADRASAGKPKQTQQGLLWLLVLLLMVVVAGLGYWQWQAQSQTAALTTDQSGQSKNLQHWQQQQQSLSQKLDDLTVANTAAQRTMDAQQTDLKNNQARMDKALVNALETMAKSQLDQGKVLPQWQLAEAEYLLRLANQRLAMEQASESAIALLKAADIIIRDSEQVGTYGIRRAIAADLAALTAVPSVDVEGVYARLAALSGMAAQLTFIPPRSKPVVADKTPNVTTEKTPEAVPKEAADWALSLWQGTKNVGASVWGELKQLVKVQSRAQEQGQQLLTPAAELLVRMRIEMALSQTQVALLRRQQTIYDQSLVGVKQLLTQYYRSSDGVAQAMHTQIDSLDKVKVLANMPNISGSLVALQGFVATLHNAPMQPLAGE